MLNSKRRFMALLLAVLMVMGCFPLAVQGAQGAALGDEAECTFDQMLEQMRSEFFSPIRPVMDLGLERVYVEGSEDAHIQPVIITPETDGGVGFEPFGGRAAYAEGSTRDFAAMVTSDPRNFTLIQGNLVRQGNHINIWVLDPDDYALKTGLVPGSPRAFQDTLADVAANTALLDEMITRFDDIAERMTRDFGAFEDVRVVTDFPNIPLVGDINEDGRINVLLYNLGGLTSGQGTTSGVFTNRDFATGARISPFPFDPFVTLEPIPMFHMNIARSFGYRMATSNLESNWLDFYETFAHELQHLLFYIHIGVYLPNIPNQGINHFERYSWFDESLS